MSSFLRTRSLGLARSLTNARRYATESTPKNGMPFGNTPLYLSVAGLVGMTAYLYIDGTKPREPLPPLTSALAKDAFIEFPLTKKERYNHNTTRYTFALPENTATLLPVASCVMIQAADVVDDKGKPIARPYTPISPSEARGEVQFLIKKYDTGKLTPHLHELKIGDKVAIKGPFPKFPYRSNEFEQVALVAGGSGITPMYQILEKALSSPEDKTKFTLIFANVTAADILLREEFDTFQKKYPNRFKAVYLLDKPDEKWEGPTGYINADVIKKHVAPPSLNEKVKVFICGPPGQVAAIAGKKAGAKQGELAGILKELGYSENQVYKF